MWKDETILKYVPRVTTCYVGWNRKTQSNLIKKKSVMESTLLYFWNSHTTALSAQRVKMKYWDSLKFVSEILFLKTLKNCKFYECQKLIFNQISMLIIKIIRFWLLLQCKQWYEHAKKSGLLT